MNVTDIITHDGSIQITEYVLQRLSDQASTSKLFERMAKDQIQRTERIFDYLTDDHARTLTGDDKIFIYRKLYWFLSFVKSDEHPFSNPTMAKVHLRSLISHHVKGSYISRIKKLI